MTQLHLRIAQYASISHAQHAVHAHKLNGVATLFQNGMFLEGKGLRSVAITCVQLLLLPTTAFAPRISRYCSVFSLRNRQPPKDDSATHVVEPSDMRAAKHAFLPLQSGIYQMPGTRRNSAFPIRNAPSTFRKYLP